MLFNNLPLPLPWYPSIELQDRFRQNVAKDQTITQLAPYDGVLPFQFRKTSTSEVPVSWVIKCAGNATMEEYIAGYVDPVVCDMSAFIFDALQWMTLDSQDVFIFKDAKNSLALITTTLPDGLPAGVYYMELLFEEFFFEIPDSAGAFVSETFRVPDDKFSWDHAVGDCNYPCLKWYHTTDIKPIHYNALEEDIFFNLLYLDTFVTASEPTFEITGEKDGKDELIPTFQKAIIKYRLSAVVPDYIKIALYLMQMHETKYIYLEKYLRRGDIKNPEVSHTLTSDGAFSSVEVLFEQMSLVTNTTCEDLMLEPPGFEIGGGPYVLTVHACYSSGDVQFSITAFPVGYYCELWGNIGSGPYTLLVAYISRAEILGGGGAHRIIGPPALYNHYKVVIRTFSFPVATSTIAGPIFDLC